MRGRSTKNMINISLGVAMLWFIGGCQSMTGETAGENVDDSSITAAVKANLVKERVGSLTTVEVKTVRKTVYLTGIVESSDWKERAGQIASNTGGVEKVVNNLQVHTPPSSGSGMSDRSGSTGSSTSPSFAPGRAGSSGMPAPETGTPSR